MKNVAQTYERAGERGAVSIKTLVTFVVLAAAAFVVIKIAPVYIEERELTHEVSELARISAVRNYKEAEIQKGIEKLRLQYNLPEGTITLISHAENSAQIQLKYNKQIDFLVTTYSWQVDYTASGKGI
ncbi:MAG TPA: hypothetical protein VNO14_14795 [Blastocatellia bacterium]|nr:hypothetical protein [Blastocatellia bacterium]